ncbi:hypothetical protein PR202_ga14026 [Eleusine coracana subsp. coracana]|uniref:Uncharacterized protein n=1 Tax=Eleusine coracana subsp. coracana TaxID=191504 RepID=A0AAV5CG82_ELECO|nr:hypothetical protein PR202_ga14026 [Eleusine coracana subsp. coracana]
MDWASAAYTAAALACAAAATVVALGHIYRHLLHYAEPVYQRFIVRIIFMVPVYSVMSFLSLIFPDSAIYFNSIREIYDAWVIYNFLSLCLAWVGGPGAVVTSLTGRSLRPSWFLMTCCFPAIPLDGCGVLVFLAAKSRYIKNAEKAADLQNFVLCVEMLIAAIGHLFAFPYKEYAGANARASGGFRESLLHALKFNDFYHDTVHQFAPTYNEYVLYNHEGENTQTKHPSGSTVPSGQNVELAGITGVTSNSPVTSSVSSNQADQDESMTTPIRDKVDPPGGLYDLTDLLDVDLSNYPDKVPAISDLRKQ